MSNNYNYKEFANDIYIQTLEIAQMTDYTDVEKQFIANFVKKYALLVGEALNKDSHFKIDKKRFITLLVAEGTYCKLFIFLKSDISKKYWESIIQKIAYTIFEIAKQGISKKISQDKVLQAIEYHVSKVHNSSLKELLEKNIITKEQYENSITNSYI